MDFCAESQLSLALPELTTRPQSLCSTSDWCSQSTLFPRYFYFRHLAELGNNPRRSSKTQKRKSIRLQLQHSPSVFLLKYQTYTLSILFPTSKPNHFATRMCPFHGRFPSFLQYHHPLDLERHLPISMGFVTFFTPKDAAPDLKSRMICIQIIQYVGSEVFTIHILTGHNFHQSHHTNVVGSQAV